METTYSSVESFPYELPCSFSSLCDINTEDGTEDNKRHRIFSSPHLDILNSFMIQDQLAKNIQNDWPKQGSESCSDWQKLNHISHADELDLTMELVESVPVPEMSQLMDPPTIHDYSHLFSTLAPSQFDGHHTATQILPVLTSPSISDIHNNRKSALEKAWELANSQAMSEYHLMIQKSTNSSSPRESGENEYQDPKPADYNNSKKRDNVTTECTTQSNPYFEGLNIPSFSSKVTKRRGGKSPVPETVKKEKRLIKNRRSAAISRFRKKAYLGLLNDFIEQGRQETVALEKDCQQLEMERNTLLQQIQANNPGAPKSEHLFADSKAINHTVTLCAFIFFFGLYIPSIPSISSSHFSSPFLRADISPSIVEKIRKIVLVCTSVVFDLTDSGSCEPNLNSIGFTKNYSELSFPGHATQMDPLLATNHDNNIFNNLFIGLVLLLVVMVTIIMYRSLKRR